MASRKENIKALFSNTRSRIIVLFLFVLVVITLLIGITKFIFLTSTKGVSGTDITGAPAIQSIPGALAPTEQYAGLVEAKNIEQAKQARATGGSAIPTIIRTQEFGSGVKPIMPEAPQGVGFAALALEDSLGAQHSLWIQLVKNGNCSKESIDKAMGQGATLNDIKAACTCTQLKDIGYALSELDQACTCKELKAAGFNARQLKNEGFTVAQLRICGFSACELRAAGFTAQELKDGGFSDGELRGAGFSDDDIARTGGSACGFSAGSGLGANDIRRAGCNVDALKRLRVSGVSAAAIRRVSGCNATQLKAAGFSFADLKNAGFTAAEMLAAGITPEQLIAAGVPKEDVDAAVAAQKNCSIDALRAAHARGVSATTLRKTMGCTAEAMRAAGFSAEELKAAGFTAAELKAAGFSAQALKNAGFSAEALREAGFSAKDLKAAGFTARELQAAGFSAKELKDAGFTAQELRNAGFSAKELKDAGFDAKALRAAGFSAAELKEAGFNAKELRDAGFSAKELKALGFSAKDLKEAGFSATDLKDAGFTARELKEAGFSAADLKEAGYSAKDLKGAGFTAKELKDGGYSLKELKDAGFSDQALQAAGFTEGGLAGAPAGQAGALGGIPGIPGQAATGTNAASALQLQAILKRQKAQMIDQKSQQQLQQRTALMQTAASQFMQGWKAMSTQVYVAESGSKDKSRGEGESVSMVNGMRRTQQETMTASSMQQSSAVIKAGDILFAVLDTSVNSDEPSPILATIVSGKFKGSKLIGNFNLPGRAEKMVINFNTLSVPGAPRTTSITAYAIDANTARTALSSSTDHHYMLRYGSLFAATFLEGFGNAIASQSTQITTGGTGGITNTVVQSTPNNAGRSLLQNALVGLATLGKSWGQVAQQQFNTPITVQVYAGTAVGILFTQDVQSL